ANQTAKLRLRVVPSLTGFARKRGTGGITPQGLALGLAAYLQWARSHPAGDADLPLIERHWRTATTLQGLAGSALADVDLWGVNLAELPGLLDATTHWLVLLERDAVEVTLTTPGAIDAIADLASDQRLAGCVIGAGTVLDESAARHVIDAGARFVVSPALDPSVIRACRDRAVPCMPGAFTPTELLA